MSEIKVVPLGAGQGSLLFIFLWRILKKAELTIWKMSEEAVSWFL